MTKVLFFFLLALVCTHCSAQCTFPLQLNTTDQCLGTATLDVSTSQTLSKIVWNNNGSAVRTVNATQVPMDGTVVAGVTSYANTNPTGPLYEPSGVAVDADGNIYVAEYGHDRVTKFPPNSVSGEYGVIVAGFPGGSLSSLYEPLNLVVDHAGNLYISDHNNHRIMKWAPGATSGIIVAGGNGAGSAANQLPFPYGVAVDAAGNIYAVDGDNSRVQKWAPGATSGVTVAGGNGQGSAANQLNEPTGMCMDAAGNIYVAEFGSNRVSKWAPGATSGVTVAGGTQGSGPDQLNGPYDVAIDAAGNLYIADLNNYRVQKWTPGATSGVTVAGGNGLGPATNQVAPHSVTVDSKGNLFVVDLYYNRVMEWGQRTSISTSYMPTTPGTYTATVTDINGCVVSSNSIVVHPVVTPSLSIAADVTTICSGSSVSFNASPVNGGNAPDYQWKVNGIDVGSNAGVYSSSSLASGDKVSCLMTSNEYCTTAATATSNTVAMTVYPAVTPPSVAISTTTPAVCSSTPVSFNADVTANGAIPQYQWMVNGVNAGTNLPSYTLADPSDGDIVVCRVSVGVDICTASAVSGSVALVVYPSPSIAPGKTVSITGGQGQMLDPQISGDIATYLWTPSDGLSDNTVRNPLADPMRSTTYLLKVTTSENCSATGEIKVNVYRDLVLPSGFSPNNDGHNDLFYVLSGPPGSIVKDLTVFNKWGAMVFQVHDATPGDPSAGWNGTYQGSPVPAGGYVYYVVVRLADGSLQRLQGTILLVR